jgi:hypothetical protein
VDAYEIQVYDGSSDDPGHAGVELHTNRDTTTRETHLTLEPSYGITRGWEVGAYLQTAFLSDGTFAWSGQKLRSKHVLRFDQDRVRVGVNLEVSFAPVRVEPDRWGGEMRPILAYEDDDVLLAFNPIIGASSDGPTFEPAGAAKVKIVRTIALGLEYYASFGPIPKPATWHEQEHYVFETIDLLAVSWLELEFGLGQGVSPNSHPLIGKMIAGVSF